MIKLRKTRISGDSSRKEEDRRGNLENIKGRKRKKGILENLTEADYFRITTRPRFSLFFTAIKYSRLLQLLGVQKGIAFPPQTKLFPPFT